MAVNHRVTFFTKTHDVAQPDVFRRPGQHEAAANPPLRGQITMAAQVMHDLDEVMA